MYARTLTNEEYVSLAAKLDAPALDATRLLKQVHRLLCDGHKVEDLTPTEQRFAAAFDGLTCTQIPNDYGWEPGIEVKEYSDEGAAEEAGSDLTLRESLGISQPPTHAPIKRNGGK